MQSEPLKISNLTFIVHQMNLSHKTLNCSVNSFQLKRLKPVCMYCLCSSKSNLNYEKPINGLGQRGERYCRLRYRVKFRRPVLISSQQNNQKILLFLPEQVSRPGLLVIINLS